MASRRKARELALQMLFQWEVGSHSPEHVVQTFLAEKSLEPSVEEFARSLFEGTVGAVATLDPLIRSQSEHWRLERMPAVDRNLLRLALYELTHLSETPPAVVINEALELARRYSGADSVEFVNGVLDGIRKKAQSTTAPG
ncbi:MAG: transcription antitermination factor NusB [Acidobacteria bacterium]|nr:MAG: transcription antitermination factor NusB [Acidobacteriota bacterium]